MGCVGFSRLAPCASEGWRTTGADSEVPRRTEESEAWLPELNLQRHRQELSDLLEQLQPVVPKRMRRVLVPGFANFGAKLFIVIKTDEVAGVESTAKKGLRAIYAGQPGAGDAAALVPA